VQQAGQQAADQAVVPPEVTQAAMQAAKQSAQEQVQQTGQQAQFAPLAADDAAAQAQVIAAAEREFSKLAAYGASLAQAQQEPQQAVQQAAQQAQRAVQQAAQQQAVQQVVQQAQQQAAPQQGNQVIQQAPEGVLKDKLATFWSQWKFHAEHHPEQAEEQKKRYEHVYGMPPKDGPYIPGMYNLPGEEDYDYEQEEQEACKCQLSWAYNAGGALPLKAYDGCSTTADADYTWCFVVDASKCKAAKKSDFEGELREWKKCDTEKEQQQHILLLTPRMQQWQEQLLPSQPLPSQPQQQQGQQTGSAGLKPSET